MFGSGLADFLGISQDQLHTELQADGATLATVAQAHGKTRDDLKAFLTDQLTKNTQQAVTDGRMTQDQANTMLQDISSRVDQMIDGNMRFGGPPRGRDAAMPTQTISGRRAPGADVTESVSAVSARRLIK